MKKLLKLLMVIAMGFLPLALVPNVLANVPAWNIESMPNNEALLHPGTTTYCNKNFVVENMGTDTATVQVIMGNGANYRFDQIEPSGKKSYALSSENSFAGGWEGAKNTQINEARIVNSTGGTAQLKVHCK